MGLRLNALDRLFKRLTDTYGNQFTNLYSGNDWNDVKTIWSDELEQFNDRLDAVAWALENLPERAPNIIQFKNLCKQAPRKIEAALSAPLPKADPERVKAELKKLGHNATGKKDADGIDHRAWAKKIINEHIGGLKVGRIRLTYARQALGINK